MNENEAGQLWATLGAEAKSPTELSRASQVLPSYSVGIDPWIDRLAGRYLKNLCREAAHFKLILAPYGGGKTHFLLSLGVRALSEKFAVSYVPCSEGVGSKAGGENGGNRPHGRRDGKRRWTIRLASTRKLSKVYNCLTDDVVCEYSWKKSSAQNEKKFGALVFQRWKLPFDVGCTQFAEATIRRTPLDV